MTRALLALSTTAVLALAAGCGGGGGSSKAPANPPGKPDAAAAKVAQGYVDDYTNHRAKPICSALAQAVVAQMNGVKGCLKQVKASFKAGVFPKLHVKAAYASGGTATAVFRDTPRQVTLTREGSAWKVSNGGT
jgi:hypothetical protein